MAARLLHEPAVEGQVLDAGDGEAQYLFGTYEMLQVGFAVIGAGGAGLRAAVEAREAGLKVAIICKSL